MAHSTPFHASEERVKYLCGQVIPGNPSSSTRAEEQLLALHDWLIRSLVAKHAVGITDNSLDSEDLYQVGRIAFLTALRRFDPDRGVQLSTFAYPYVLGAICRELGGQEQSKAASQNGLSVIVEYMDELDHSPSDSSDAVPQDDIISDLFVVPAVSRFLRTLSPTLFATANCLFWDDMTQAETARALGVSRMAVSKNLRRLVDLARGQLAEVACAA